MRRIILLPLLLLALAAGTARTDAPRVVEITAKRYEFDPKVVTLKKNQPVTIRVTALDRPHGLLIAAFHVDLDAAPSAPAEATITPTETGKFEAICDHYCGIGHGGMKMTFVVEE